MAALDGRLTKPAPARPAWALWCGLAMVAMAAGVAGWWWQSGSDASAVQAPVARTAPAADRQVAQVAVPVPAAPATSAASAPAEAASASTARAVIEETAVGDAKAVAASAPAEVARDGAVASVALAAETPVAKPPRAKEKALAKTAATEPPKERAKVRNKDNGQGSTKTAAAEAKPAQVAADAALTGQTPRDADVELLAALMHYTDEVGAPGTGKTKAPSSAARMNELTIADLVKRCQALGGDEAAQCKKRICSGYWGKAEACPAKQAPVASKHKKQPA